MKRVGWVLIGALLATADAASSEWAEGMSDRICSPNPEATLEVRILVGGIVIPWHAYVISQTTDGVVGKRFLWLDTPNTKVRAATDRLAARDHRDLMKDDCGKRLRESPPDLWWCETASDAKVDWKSALASLPIDALWTLASQKTLGEPPCRLFDGVGVRIEVRSHDNANSVVYWNPDECCPWPECAVAEKVLKVVNELR